MRLTLFLIALLLLTFTAPTFAKAQEAGTSRVIVALNTEYRTTHSANPMGLARAFVLAQADILNARVTAESDEWVIPYVALEVDAAAREALESSPYVSAIYEDYLAEPMLAESVPKIDAPLAWAHGFDGADQAVVILDSGIDASHDFFSGRIATEACFSTTDPGAVNGGAESLCPNGADEQIGSGAAALTRCNLFAVNCNHGTHVAGIAAGRSDTIKGVAPGANIIPIQIFTKFKDCNPAFGDQPCALTYSSDQIAALNHVYSLRNSFSIAAVNMSLGSDVLYSNQTTCDNAYAPTKAAIDLLRSAGIATVISSGNYYSITGISAPACISSAIAVGATADDDRIARYSNMNAMVDLVAPGGRSAASITGTGIQSSFPGGGFGTLSGTSMAAPHVVGAWAIIKQAAPNASVSDVLAAFQQSGVLVTDGPTRDDNNCPCSTLDFRRIDVDGALDLFPTAPPMPMLNTPDDYAFFNTTPVLRWIAVPNASAYTVQIATDVAFTQLLPNYPLVTSATSHTPQPLAPGGTFYWRVRSLNNSGHASEYSAYRTMYINGAPQRGFAESASITLTWGPISWATDYEIWLDIDPKFKTPMIYYRTVPDIPFDGLTSNTYYWRVRATNATTIGAWSSTQSFTIKAP